MLAVLTLLALFAMFYSYFGYPLLLMLLPKKSNSNFSLLMSEGSPVSITIIIAARNEEAVIREKIENTLALITPLLSAQVIVASDCSDDETDNIVKSFESRGVELIRAPERNGKEAAQLLAVGHATGDIIVFTDAKVSLEAGALEKFQRYFSDSTIGAVSSFDRIAASGGPSSGEGFYVRYEMWLRQLETRFNSVVGLSGSCFAVRRFLCGSMRTDIPSDFALLLECIRKGKRGILADDIICFYRPVKSEEQEFERKVRTIVRGIRALMIEKEILNLARHGAFAWQITSHKLFRWLVPLFLIVFTYGVLFLGTNSPFFLLLADGLLVFYLLAFLGYLYKGLRTNILFKVPLFFVLTNTAIGLAWLKYFSGEKAVTWSPSPKG